MKKVIVLFAVLMLMSVGVFAGPYFSAETTMGIAVQSGSSMLGFEIAPMLTGGYDFSTTVQSADGTLGSRVFGDVNFTFPTNDLDATLGMGFAGVKIEAETLLDFNREVDALNAWNTSFTVTGYPYTGLKTWGKLSFNFDYDSGLWSLVPVLGIEGRW